RRELDVLDAAGGLGADVVVVVRLAADDRAEAGERRVAAGLGQVLRRERELERAGHVVDVELHGGLGERPLRALDQPGGEVLVEAADDDAEPLVAHRPSSRSRSASAWSISSSSASAWWWIEWTLRCALARGDH